jgi:hypothetical protein
VIDIKSETGLTVEAEEFHSRLFPLDFEKLSPQEVNDLIATKVMEWHLNSFKVNWFKDGLLVAQRWLGGEKSGDILNLRHGDPTSKAFVRYFNPYHSLDDCWLAEEALYAKYDGWHRGYSVVLEMIVSPKERARPSDHVHATAVQRCEAMLREMGVCK